MNEIKKILIVLVTINTLTFAELSKGQLLEYLELSWVFKGFKDHQDNEYDTLFDFLNIDRNLTNLQKIEEMKKYAYCDASTDAFLYEISQITNEEYFEIISFYRTDEGKKMSEGYMEIDNTTLEKVSQQLQKERKQLEKKQILIKSIFEEFNIIELKVKYKLDKLIVARTIDKESSKYTTESIKKSVANYKSSLKNFARDRGGIIFQNFTIKELEEVLAYAKTKGGKREMEVFFNGMTEAYAYQIYACGKYFDNLKSMPDHK